jgi:hypothetical protein
LPILKTLLYFSIFHYPLTKEEIFIFSKTKTLEEVDKQLAYLQSKNIIFQFGPYYSITNTINGVKRRELGSKKAQAIMPKAKKVSRLISKFPYVESVCISGALSKGYYDEIDGDFDFFIITKPNRLWIARTLLILYKKTVLLNSKKYFCVNYFISTSHLKIAERNRFTATEIITLLPLSGKEVFNDFINANDWTTEYFPNSKQTDLAKISTVNKPMVSKALESVFNTKIGDYFDEFFRKLTLQKWKKRFGYLDEEDFKIAMKSTKNVSKHHPRNFQNKVIIRLNHDYKSITKKHNLQIPQEYA